MTSVHYLWDPIEDNIIRELDNAGSAAAEYTTEPNHFGSVFGQHRGGQSRFFHHDGMGSAVAVTDENANVTDTRAYAAYGEITETSGSTVFPYQYIGQKGYYTDIATGQCLVRRREYEPSTARWVSRDIIPDLLPQNGYAYTNNRPTANIDPSGLLCMQTGNAQYYGCGRLVWGANIRVEDADIESIDANSDSAYGGFVIQQVCQMFQVTACPGEDVTPISFTSAKCGTYITAHDTRDGFNDPPLLSLSMAQANCYWEMWPLNKLGWFTMPGVRTPALAQDRFQSKPLDTAKTFGFYYQEGRAYFVAGGSPPDGWDRWTVDKQSPAGSLYMRCDRPSGVPADLGAVGRKVAIGWNCCAGTLDVNDCRTTPRPRPLDPNELDWAVLEESYFQVNGRCGLPRR